MKAIFASLLVLTLPLVGCVAHVRPAEFEYAPPPTVYVDGLPYVTYGGVPTYFYGDRWYQRRPGGWGYLRVEPYELRRQRPYVQQAPPAYRRGGPRPMYPANPRPNVAPPAHRR